MTSFIKTSFSTFALRLLVIGAKFGLFMFLGKFVAESDIGVYGMIATIVMLLAQILGMEFHYYNTREIQKKPVGTRGSLIRDQFVLHFITYCITFPLVILFFIFGFIDFIYIFYFYALLLFECLSQELFRILAANQMPVAATFNLFFRTVPWVVISSIVIYFGLSESVVKVILLSWFLSSLSATVFSLFILRHEISLSKIRTKIDFQWIKRGIISVIPFMISAIAGSTALAIDKFIIKYFIGDAALGIYFFMFSLAGGYYTLLTFSVGIIYGPKVLYSYHNESTKDFLATRKEGLVKTFIAGAILLPPAILGIYIVLFIIDNEIYNQNINIYFLLLAANVIWAFADVLNYDLYVRYFDKIIMYISIVGALITTIIQAILVSLYSIQGAAVAAIISFSALVIIRYLVLKRKVPGYSLLMTYDENIDYGIHYKP